MLARAGDGGREPRDGAVAGSEFCAPLDAFAPVAGGSGSAAFKGVWSIVYTNGHRDAYTIDAAGRVRRSGGGHDGAVVPQGADADGQRDDRYAGKWYLPSTHRPGVWEYIWLSADGEKMFLRHFCVDGHCSQTSPDGSPNFCCSATGTRSGDAPEHLAEL